MMIRNGSRDDLPRLRALFASANDAPADLSLVAEEKCFGDGVAGRPTLRVFEQQQTIRGAAVSCGKWLRVLIVARDARRSGIGSALLADAEALGTSVVAAEPGNYLTPGIVISDTGTLTFLERRGYERTATTSNLHVALGHFEQKPATRRANREEQGKTLEFIEREFGPIWRFEAARAFEREHPTLFVTEENGAVTGFAAHDVNNRGLGFFGPTGVAKSMRGRGLGCALLHSSLADLRRLGFARAVIPWTDALAFYERCSGAEPAHQFVAFAKRRT